MNVNKNILILLLFLELGYSFVQYQHQPMDGDIVPIVLPTEHYQTILEQPFGCLAIQEGEKYAGVNRFFLHFSMYHYFRNVPLFLQNFVSPIESVYLASSLFKLLVHSFLLYLLAAYISACHRPFERSFLCAAVLIAPLFQVTQFNLYMGVVNPAIAYTFSYGFFFSLFLLFLFPFYKMGMKQPLFIKKWTFLSYFIWVALAVFLAFSGPLISSVVLLVSPMLLLFFLYKSFNKSTTSTEKKPLYQQLIKAISEIPKPVLILFPFFILLSLYSFYLGTFNAENSETMNLVQRYQRLGIGIFRQLTSKLGFPLLLLFLITNYIFIKKIKPENKVILASKILGLFRWIGIFSLIYILLLPLGGYRSYRPNILRSDTLIPVLLAMYFLFGLSSLFLLNYFNKLQKKGYSFAILALIVFFTIADEPNFGENACEKKALQQMAHSTENIVILKKDCPVMTWETTMHPSASRDVVKMLLDWNIIEKEQLFYYKKQNNE